MQGQDCRIGLIGLGVMGKNFVLNMADYFSREIMHRQADWRAVVQQAVSWGLPVPGLAVSLAYYDAYRRERLPANLTQAQRDFFGSHTYERLDMPGTFHTEWERVVSILFNLFLPNKEMHMDDETKAHLEELNKRIGSTEQRFDDMKWYFGGVTTFFMLFFSLLTLILSWNFKNERDNLREFQKDIKEELGKVSSVPEIELLGINRESLANQMIKANFLEKENAVSMVLNIYVRNTGNASSGLMYIKLYASDPIKLYNKSTDEAKFQYEEYIKPKNLDPNEIPGKFSIDLNFTIPLNDKTLPPDGTYPMLMKVFFGKGKIVQAPFNIIVSKK